MSVFSFEQRVERLTGKPRQLLILIRHFFDRLFQNEIFPFEEQMKEKLIIALVLLALLGGNISVCVFGRYGMMEKYLFLLYDPGTWVDKCFFIAFFMIVLAIIVVLDWDILFPDQKDVLNIMPLPVRAMTVFQAKFISFLILIGLYTTAVNSISTLVVSFFLPQLRSWHFGFMIRYAAAHVVSTTAAFIFTFFLLSLINGVFLLILSPRIYRRLSLFLRFWLLIGLVFLMMVLLVNSFIMPDMFGWLGRVLDRGTGVELYFPPLWFTGLYEWLLGSRNPVMEFGAWAAIASVLLLPLLYFGLLALTYRRHLGKGAEEASSRKPFARFRQAASLIFQDLALRDGAQRAVYYFFVRTFRSSPRHRIRIAAFLALGIGLSIISLLNSGISSLRSFSTRDINVLSVQLILYLFLLIGLRSAAGVPIAPEANWIFKLTETRASRHYLVGMKKAMTARTIVPIAIIVFILYARAWGVGKAALHSAFGFAWALILLEVLFWGYSKIPFCCLTAPGKTKIYWYWSVYGLGVLLFIRGLSALEREMFGNLMLFVPFFGFIAVSLTALWAYQRIFSDKNRRIIYEDEPERILLSLE
jgi:hypothetical protein